MLGSVAPTLETVSSLLHLTSLIHSITATLHTQHTPLPLPLQQTRLLPQRIGLKLPKRRLDPIPPLPIRTNLLSRPKRSSHQPSLATKEQPSSAQKHVRRHIAGRARLQHAREIGNGFFTSAGEFDGGGLLVRFEGVEHGCAVGAQAVGEEEAQAYADHGAYRCVHGDGAGGGLEALAVVVCEADPMNQSMNSYPSQGSRRRTHVASAVLPAY